MATKASKTAVKTTSSKSAAPVDQEVANVVHDNADSLVKVYSAIQADEAARDADIDRMEAELDEHLEMLEQKGVSYHDREAIRVKAEARIDKKRQYNIEHQKENTKRWNTTLWVLTLGVIGVAALKYAPDIIGALCRNKRI